MYSNIVLLPDLIQHIHHFQYNVRKTHTILKMIHAGVGFELGLRLSWIVSHQPPRTLFTSLHLKHWIVVTPSKTKLIWLYFFDQMPRLLYITLVCFTFEALDRCDSKLILLYFFDQMLWLLFGGSFVVKPADSNDDWIRYVWVIQLGMIDAGSSTRSFSVLLSAVETSLRTWTALEIAQWLLVGSTGA